jgi:hypothetical protein
MIDHIFSAVERRLQFSENGSIGTEEIKERNRKDQQQAGNKPNRQEDDLHIGNKFLVMRKLVSPDQVKNQESKRYDAVVDTIFQKRILRGREKSKMPAEKDKSGDVPAHNEHTNGHAHDSCADRIHIAQVLRRKEQCVGAKAFHKAAVHNAEHECPKKYKDLVFSKMKKKQL